MPYKPTGKPRGRPKGYPAFARMEQAREAFQSRAKEYVDLHRQATKVAAKKGNSQPAQWALEHMSVKDEKGVEHRIISSGIDRQVEEGGSRAPVINIGWVQPAALPSVQVQALPEAIDVPSEDD